MPPKKVTGRRKGYKRTATRYRKYVGRRRKTLVPRSLTYNVHYFKRSINGTDDVFNCLVDGTRVVRDGVNHYFQFNCNSSTQGTKQYGTLAYQFSIESLPAGAEFTSLFDEYRINKVVVKITPTGTIVDGSAPGVTGVNYSSFNPMLHWVIDHDDITMPTIGTANENDIDNLRHFNSYKTRRLITGKPISIVIKPRPTTYTNQSEFSGLNLNMKKMGAWIDAVNVNVKHYGLKMIFSGIQPVGGVNYVLPFDIQTTYYMSFKGVR